MRKHTLLPAIMIVAALAFVFPNRHRFVEAQPRAGLSDEQIARRHLLEKELQSIAIVDRKLMIPMRDGVRIAADVYRPKDTSKKYPTIFSRTPYNFNFWDVRNRVPADMSTPLDAVKRGYAYVVMNERGHFFSEGNHDILGPPLSDGDDELTWIAKQPWSNGKVGLIGCSSTAEWQLAVAALGNPALAAIIPQGFGAGVGRVAPYWEQGNWYRGGAVQMLFIAWLYGEQNQLRPMFPRTTSQEDLIRASRMFDLAPQMPPVDWSKALRHLPVMDIYKAIDGPRGIFADEMPVPTGGAMIKREPNDPAWYKGGLWHDHMKINVPGFWFMSWYDVSVGPNLAAYNHVRRTASPAIANQQYAVIAPTQHCAFRRATENTVVGERSMGDARLNYDELNLGLVRSLSQRRRQRPVGEDAKGALLHDGHQQVASVRHLATEGRPAAHVLSFERRQSQHLEWRRRPGRFPTRDRCAGQIRLRSDEPGAVLWRQCLLHGKRDYRRRVRSAQDGGTQRHPGLQH